MEAHCPGISHYDFLTMINRHGQAVGVRLLALARKARCIPPLEARALLFSPMLSFPVPHELCALRADEQATDADLKRLVKETVMSPMFDEVKALEKTVLECTVLDHYDELVDAFS